MAGDEDENLSLMDRDRLVIHNISEYMGEYTVSAHGEVNNSGSYPYASNMTVRDLILVAGNVKKSAYMEDGEIIRFDIIDGKSVQTSLLNFNVSQALESDPGQNHKLQPWDIVNIKQIPEWGEGKVVTITGEVAFPGSYSIRKDERLSSIINRAGGYTENAYFRGAVFTRDSVKVLQKKRLEELINRLSVEVTQISARELAGALSSEDVKGEQAIFGAQQNLISRLRNVETNGRVVIRLVPGPAFDESTYNLVLEDKDALYIPPKPDTVVVSGEVYNPTSLIYNSEKPQLKYYLAKTGGPTKYANTKEMFILLADGTVVSKSASNAFVSGFENTELYPGDTLIVPPKLLHPRFMRDLKDITSIIYQIAVSAGIIINQVFP
jgi:protein involved in polysaccharide export with SLBB domain